MPPPHDGHGGPGAAAGVPWMKQPVRHLAAALEMPARPLTASEALALLLSILGSPFLTPLYTAVAIVGALAANRRQFLLWISLIGIFFVGSALSFVVVQVLRGEISDLHVSEPSQRQGAFTVAVCSSIAGTFGLWWLEVPWMLVALGSSFAMQGIIFSVMTRCDKVSMHVAVTASCVTALVLLFGWSAAPLVGILPAQGWARIYRGRHTIRQVVTGAVVAPPLTLLTLLPWWALGLIA